MEHGHPGARHYPLAMVWEEVELVEKRMGSVAARQAVLFQLALATIPTQGDRAADVKKRIKTFQGEIEKLVED